MTETLPALEPLLPHARAADWLQLAPQLLYSRFHYRYNESPKTGLVVDIPGSVQLLKERAAGFEAEVGDRQAAYCFVLAGAALELSRKILDGLRAAAKTEAPRQAAVSLLVFLEGECEALLALLLDVGREYAAGNKHEGQPLSLAAVRCAHSLTEELARALVALQLEEIEQLPFGGGARLLAAIADSTAVQRELLLDIGAGVAVIEGLCQRLGVN